MKRETKFKVILAITLIFISCSSIRPASVLAQTSTTSSTVEADWLSVVPGTFVDLSQNLYENKLKVAVGGEDLLSFQSLGVVYSETDSSQIVYKSRAVFGEEIVAYSAVTLRDTFSNFNTNDQNSMEYFRLDRYYIWGATTERYHINWYEASFDAPTYHDYNGYLPVTFSIKPFLDTTGYINVGGVSIPAPTYSSEISQAKIQNLKSGECGVYQDEFVDVGIQDTKITIVPTVDTFTAPEKALMDWYNNHDLGLVGTSVIRPITLNQGVLDADPVGTTYHNPTPQESLTAKIGINIVPEVYKYTQDITMKRAGIVYWQWGFFSGLIDPIYGVETRVVPRIVGAHVSNYFIHYTVVITVDFYATVPSTAQLTQTVLNDPYLQVGSFIWDTSLFGTESAELPWTTGDFWLTLLSAIMPWLIVIIIVVIVIVGVYLYILFRKRKGNPVQIFIGKEKGKF